MSDKRYLFVKSSPEVPAPGEVTLRGWFEELQKNDRGGRAVLRRASNLEAVQYAPTFARLYLALKKEESFVSRHRLAAVATVCAHVREDDEPAKKDSKAWSLGRRMGSPKEPGGTSPTVSQVRFRRLLACERVDDAYRQWTRLLKLLGGRADIRKVAEAVYWWEKGRVRRDLALAYYEALPGEN